MASVWTLQGESLSLCFVPGDTMVSGKSCSLTLLLRELPGKVPWEKIPSEVGTFYFTLFQTAFFPGSWIPEWFSWVWPNELLWSKRQSDMSSRAPSQALGEVTESHRVTEVGKALLRSKRVPTVHPALPSPHWAMPPNVTHHLKSL